jgi:UDP-N-acetylmuramate--alanine ligase
MGFLRAGIHVHLVGIGGIGLSAIARVLKGWGYQVSGSDRQSTALTAALAAEGITVYAGHRAEQVAGADLVVVSSAVPQDNPEVAEALRRGLPVVKRAAFLGELTAGKVTIAVAGTHGKTTTSAMIAWVLLQAGLDPTFVVGGVLQNLGTNARAGRGPHFVIEADEYDRTFLGLRPAVAAITVLEHDHPDCFPTFDKMRVAYTSFVQQVVAGGLLVVCGEDKEARQLGAQAAGGGLRVMTYGTSNQWDWWAQGASLGNHATFEIWQGDDRLGTCALQVPGRHNVLNALAALAVCSEIGIDFEVATSALTRFRGTERRFEVKGQEAGVTVVDDYAHHPTEIRATLDAARIKFPGRQIWAVFQPHTYSRTAALMDDFAAALEMADHVLVTGIYAARESDTLGISGADIVARIEKPGAAYVPTLGEAVATLLDRVRPGDVVITLGAGDGYLIGEALLAKLREQEFQP